MQQGEKKKKNKKELQKELQKDYNFIKYNMIQGFWIS